MRASWFLRVAVCGAVALVSAAAPLSAGPPSRLALPGPVGTMDTVAGPGFCAGPSAPDPASHAVGALAVDPVAAGPVWFEMGPPGQGMVTKVLNSGSVLIERTGNDGSPAGRDRQRGDVTRSASASRLAPDRRGAVLVAKPTSILRLEAGGLTTLAGARSGAASANPAQGRGDGGPLANARFDHIGAIATDEAGNVYVTDEADREPGAIAIRFLNLSDKAVTFFAGSEQELTVPPGTVDTIVGGADAARSPAGLRLAGRAPALAVAGDRLYVALSGRTGATVSLINLSASELSAHGKTVRGAAIAVVANVGTGAQPGAPRAEGSALPGIAADGQGNLFLAERTAHRVRRLDGAGAFSVVAGTGARGFNGNDRPATTARLDGPYDVAVGPGGRLYVSDAGNAQVRFVDQAGIIHAALGNGAGARWTCVPGTDAGGGAPAPVPAQPGKPSGLAVAAGRVYVATAALGQVQHLAPSASLAPVVGRRSRGCPRAGGCSIPEAVKAEDATLDDPAAMAPRPGGGLYVQDRGGIRFLNLTSSPATVHGVVVAPGTLHTVAGGTDGANDHDGGPARDASIWDRDGYGALAADRKGNLFLADRDPVAPVASARLRQVDSSGTITTLFPVPNAGIVDGKLDATRCCSFVAGLALDPADNLYVAASQRVWFFNRSPHPMVVHGVTVRPGAIEPVAGSAGEGSRDEAVPALEAQLPSPENLALDRSGNLYVVMDGEHLVRRIDPSGTITTVAGSGQRGFSGDGLKGPLSALHAPTDITLDACGNLLIADTGNERVRRLNLVDSCPAAAATPATTGRRRPVPEVVLALVGVVAVGTLALGQLRRGRRSSPAGTAVPR